MAGGEEGFAAVNAYMGDGLIRLMDGGGGASSCCSGAGGVGASSSLMMGAAAATSPSFIWQRLFRTVTLFNLPANYPLSGGGGGGAGAAGGAEELTSCKARSGDGSEPCSFCLSTQSLDADQQRKYRFQEQRALHKTHSLLIWWSVLALSQTLVLMASSTFANGTALLPSAGDGEPGLFHLSRFLWLLTCCSCILIVWLFPTATRRWQAGMHVVVTLLLTQTIILNMQSESSGVSLSMLCSLIHATAFTHLLPLSIAIVTYIIICIQYGVYWCTNEQELGLHKAALLIGSIIMSLFALNHLEQSDDKELKMMDTFTENIENHAKALLKNMVDGVVLVNAEGKITDFNLMAEKMFGWTKEEVMGTSIFSLLHKGRIQVPSFTSQKCNSNGGAKKWEDIANAIAQSGDEDESDENESEGTKGKSKEKRLNHLRFTIAKIKNGARVMRKDGTKFPVMVSVSNILPRDTKGNAVFMIFFRDISELQSMHRRLEEALDSESRFISNMSHEMRTPLNGILGMCQLLQDTQLDNQQMEFCETIENCGDHLLSLINNILDLKQLQEGTMPLVSVQFNLKNLLEDVLNVVSHKAIRKHLHLLFATSPEIVHSAFYGDAVRIKQILLNLLSNAVKYTSQGLVMCSVEVLEKDNKVYDLLFQVFDTGQGIQHDDIIKLFKRFSQLDNYVEKREEGVGLGLWICRDLLRRMGSDITVESVWGKGSVFSFILSLTFDPDSYLMKESLMQESEKDSEDSQSASEKTELAENEVEHGMHITELKLRARQHPVTWFDWQRFVRTRSVGSSCESTFSNAEDCEEAIPMLPVSLSLPPLCLDGDAEEDKPASAAGEEEL
ncbi:histidine kinase [Balamuthia mandrillaris]